MNPVQSSMALLAVIIAALSVWWIGTTLKEGRKALDESKEQWKRKEMKQFKTLFPFIAALGVYFLALNSPMQKQINQKHLVGNEIKSIPIEVFK